MKCPVCITKGRLDWEAYCEGIEAEERNEHVGKYVLRRTVITKKWRCEAPGCGARWHTEQVCHLDGPPTS